MTATDLVLRVTEMLREAKVVGKFVEFHGEGAASLPATDRATIANMAPEYGATMGFFPVDEETCQYLSGDGTRRTEQVERRPKLLQGAGHVRHAASRARASTAPCSSSTWPSIEPSVAGPKRPQDRIELPELKEKFRDLLLKPVTRKWLRQVAGRDSSEALSRQRRA